MKFREIIFPRPMKILQIYSTSFWYTKRVRSYNQREEIRHTGIQSKSGFVADHALYLPENAIEHMDLEKGALLTIEDHFFDREKGDFAFDGERQSTSNYCLNLGTPHYSSIFELRQGEALELHLNDNDELPKRKGFKVCDLRQGEPVEIKINFKYFMPLHGTDRFLDDRTYIYEYLGEFDRCYLLREPYDAVNRQIPQDCKMVNLLKQIWM